MLKNFVALVGIGALLVSCANQEKDVESVSTTVVVPGSAADFEQNIANTAYFGFDRYNLTAEAKDNLEKVVAWLNMYAARNVCVEGHTDARGTQDYNIGLASRRAESVKAYLVSKGIDTSRVSTISYGKESLASQGNTEQDHALNRRAHIIVVE
ncbi:MAG: OmpA family protein [Holosporales bacterium]|nr:OmpA family protein [Holosporales bacterium]